MIFKKFHQRFYILIFLNSIFYYRNAPDFEDQEKFKAAHLDYVENFWVHGVYPPKIWNCWKKKHNTNNHQEVR